MGAPAGAGARRDATACTRPLAQLVPLKPDAGEIAQFIDELPGALHLDERRARWPRYIWRFDDVRQVAEILRRGRVLSREQCTLRGLPQYHMPNREIIERTKYAHKWVRLYFRPRTPTQHNMEGIRAKAQITPTGEHCPVPVFLLFDSKELLATEGVQFTDGSAAREGRYTIGSDVAFLRTIPFESVYHDSPLPNDAYDRSEIIFRRQAEVLVNDELPLDSLRRIVCRVGPERDTLLTLLGDQAERWATLMLLEPPGTRIFFRTGTFVESMVLVGDQLHTRMAVRAQEYDAEIVATDPATGEELGRFAKETARFPQVWALPLSRHVERAYVKFRIESAIAYEGIVSQQAVFQ